MKLFKQFMLMLLLTGFSLTAFGQTVASDRNLNVDISEFETFAWSSHAANDKDVYFLSNAVLKAYLRDAIRYELEARNFEYKQSKNADLLVNFRIFDEPVTLEGYEKTYVDENYWAVNEIRKDMIGIKPEAEVRTMDDREEYWLKKGSLIIQLVHIESGQIIWQGYADEMLKEFDDNEIKSAVKTIFDKEFNFSS